MRTLLSVVAALALAVGVYADQSPTHVTAVSGGIGGDGFVTPPIQINPGDEIYNSLDITDRQAYNAGNGDAWSGTAIFGQVLDLQACDEFRSEEDCCLDVVIRDYVGFIGNPSPANGSYVALYADTGNCVPVESAFCDGDGQPTSTATFSDSIFGLVGMRNTVQTDGACCVPAGSWFIEIQPHDESSNGDWYYCIRTTNEVRGCESYGRDGGRAPGGYGFTTWTAFSTMGFGAGTISQAVTVKCGPPKPRCIYQVNKVKNLTNLCGNATCADCPYTRGDIVCTTECPNGSGDCRTSLKGTNACSGGTACKIKAGLLGCDIPPRNCKRCR